MNWTKEKPTESGWYWVFVKAGEVKDVVFYDAGWVRFSFPISGYEWDQDYEVGDVFAWMGPLPEPPNPTED